MEWTWGQSYKLNWVIKFRTLALQLIGFMFLIALLSNQEQVQTERLKGTNLVAIDEINNESGSLSILRA